MGPYDQGKRVGSKTDRVVRDAMALTRKPLWLPACVTLQQALFLAALMLVAGALSVRLGQDANWDLQNYHLYNAWALLSGRHAMDPGATPQWYLNPALDIPYYLLIKLFGSHPRLVAFLQGSQVGLLWFALWHLVQQLSRGCSFNPLVRWIAWVAACSGSMLISEVGTTFNDIPETGLVLFGVLFVHASFDDERSSRQLATGFLLLGLAAGLKLTSGIFVVAAGTALICCTRSIAKLGTAILAAMVGVAAAGGWWFVYLQQHYGSPVFPFFNGLFRSPWWPVASLTDLRFFPRNTLQWLFYPAYWVAPQKNLVTEVSFADGRMLVGLLSAVGMVVAIFVQWIRQARHGAVGVSDAVSLTRRFVVVFFLASYAIWLVTFAIYRYAMPLECLSPLLALCFAQQFAGNSAARRKTLAVLVGSMLVLVMVQTRYPDWMRAGYGKSVLELETELDAKGVTVLGAAGDPPIAHIFAQLTGTKHVLTVGDDSFIGTQLFADQTDVIHASSRLLVITKQGASDEFAARLRRYWNLEFAPGSCEKVASNIGGEFLACELLPVGVQPAGP